MARGIPCKPSITVLPSECHHVLSTFPGENTHECKWQTADVMNTT